MLRFLLIQNSNSNDEKLFLSLFLKFHLEIIETFF